MFTLSKANGVTSASEPQIAKKCRANGEFTEVAMTQKRGKKYADDDNVDSEKLAIVTITSIIYIFGSMTL